MKRHSSQAHRVGAIDIAIENVPRNTHAITSLSWHRSTGESLQALLKVSLIWRLQCIPTCMHHLS